MDSQNIPGDRAAGRAGWDFRPDPQQQAAWSEPGAEIGKALLAVVLLILLLFDRV